MRIQLLPGLHVAWRAPDAVQFGLGPRHAAVVEGLTAPDAALLDRLVDGIGPEELAAADPRDRVLVGLLRDAGALVPSRVGHRARTVVGPHREDLADDAAAWALAHRGCGDGWELLAARRRRQVLVVGTGRVADAVARALGRAEVGAVERRDRLTTHAVRSRAGGDTDAQPCCVVLVEDGAADSARAADLVRRDVPHLSVVVREADVVIGPLVRPGDGPCLRCLDLHRGDRDPAWPTVLAQILGAGRSTPQEPTVALLAGGLAALQVLAQLDGVHRPATAGATLEVELPDGTITRRRWRAHPECGCARLPAADDDQGPPGGDLGGPPADDLGGAPGDGGRSAAAGATMIW